MAPITTTMTSTASIEIPDSGATRDPTHSPSSGAPVQMLSVTTPIAAHDPHPLEPHLHGAEA